ncbi:uncharacterized protein LOC112094788, partial [Morus notabilis]|uniref:uncharacterized protein LOC112094788 n=1 Tax=Morus notabilis TaxID=981085 RepID=UPI000CED2BE6
MELSTISKAYENGAPRPPSVHQESIAKSATASCTQHEKAINDIDTKETEPADNSQKKVPLDDTQRKKMSHVELKNNEVKLVVDNIENIVAIGEIADLGGPESVVHGMTLGEKDLRVFVTRPIKKDARLPNP